MYNTTLPLLKDVVTDASLTELETILRKQILPSEIKISRNIYMYSLHPPWILQNISHRLWYSTKEILVTKYTREFTFLDR